MIRFLNRDNLEKPIVLLFQSIVTVLVTIQHFIEFKKQRQRYDAFSGESIPLDCQPRDRFAIHDGLRQGQCALVGQVVVVQQQHTQSFDRRHANEYVVRQAVVGEIQIYKIGMGQSRGENSLGVDTCRAEARFETQPLEVRTVPQGRGQNQRLWQTTPEQ